MNYLFEYAKQKVIASGYGSLADHEKWDWHGDTYGWRRARLGVSADERSSPCDPDGRWFDEARAKLAEEHYRALSRPRPRADAWNTRDIHDAWARDRGYRDFENYKAAERIDHVEACKRLILSLPGPRTIPRAAGGKLEDPHAVAAWLGVRAREQRAAQHDPDALRRGRIALGIEQQTETAE